MTEADRQQYQLSLKHPDVEEPIDLWFYRPVGFRVALLGRRLGWTPNQITVASIFLGIGCGVLCYPTAWWLNLLGVGLLVMADVCDSADGQLARLTHQYSQPGRILDGAAGDFWFASIYIGIALRLTPEWGVWAWVLAVATGFAHTQQAAMADYYRQFHLLCVKGENGSELDDAAAVARQYAALRLSDDPVQKVFLWFYRNYTRQQERLTPRFQQLRRLIGQRGGLTPEMWQQLRQRSLPLMPMANVLSFNCRAITLCIALLVGMPWLYWLVELVGFSVLCGFMMWRHESMSRWASLRLNERAQG